MQNNINEFYELKSTLDKMRQNIDNYFFNFCVISGGRELNISVNTEKYSLTEGQEKRILYELQNIIDNGELDMINRIKRKFESQLNDLAKEIRKDLKLTEDVSKGRRR